MDYDYDEALPEAARQWLAAFTEEHYRGWRLKREKQVTTLKSLRAAGAANQRIRRNGDALVHSHSLDEMTADPELAARYHAELSLSAGALGIEVQTMRGRNVLEEALVDALDRKRIVDRAVEAAQVQASPGCIRPSMTPEKKPRRKRASKTDRKRAERLLEEASSLPAELRQYIAKKLAA